MNLFGMMNFRTSGAVLTFAHKESPSGSSETISPALSTWPWTKCQPIRVNGWRARSRLTGEPGRSSISDVFRRVSGERLRRIPSRRHRSR
ncbi:hypothetical protein MRB53_019466 [Persea americana]|uniref:Uncharacterized protein n=1 Tax=Persea americana TaxID=3435 RepID=A0ACC2KZC4_PERAE|nr:hypothetical protein MRB53_019466 [Persea americana]